MSCNSRSTKSPRRSKSAARLDRAVLPQVAREASVYKVRARPLPSPAPRGSFVAREKTPMTQITQLLRRAMQTAPRRIATEFQGRSRTWEQFGERAARLAGALAALGIARGERVGVLALNSDRYLECLFALPWGGFVVVPINTRLAPP